jgi:hypothetical protein
MLGNSTTPRTCGDANNRKEPLHFDQRAQGAVAAVVSAVRELAGTILGTILGTAVFPVTQSLSYT